MGTQIQQPTDSTDPPTVSDESANEAEDTEPDRDEMFHLLRNQRRRFAIHHLKYSSGPIDIGDLATQVAAWENDIPVEEVTSKQRRRVYNSLQQTHIPSLDESDLIEEERGEVCLTDEAEKLDIYLELVPEKDIPWSEYYLGLGAVGLAVLAVAWLNVGPFGQLPDIAVGVFLAVSLIVSSVVHYCFDPHKQLLGGEEKPPELRGE